MCPVGGALFDGRSRGLRAHLVCHCLLIETDAGLVLVDTGIGARDVADHGRVAGFFRLLNNVQFRPEETAVAQVRALGFSPSDVRHIVLTHLDFDHAGGLEDFPRARVHLLAREREVAQAAAQGGAIARRRYRPRQWDEVGAWSLYPMARGERWMGFKAVRDLEGLPPEILLVPLVGHTLGHAGVAIDTGAGWMLHAGDAYFHADEMVPVPRVTPGLGAYQRLMDSDRGKRLANQTRLRALKQHSAGLRLFCAHDAAELAQLQADSRSRRDM